MNDCKYTRKHGGYMPHSKPTGPVDRLATGCFMVGVACVLSLMLLAVLSAVLLK